jgi:predicted O-linked N-acetylglucosamine transferase (SPINDLY family)
LHQHGHLEAAASLYQQVLIESPRDFDATHLLGVICLQQGRLDEAQRLINAAVAIKPHDGSAAGNLGTSYLRDGKFEAALHWFETARELQPDSLTALTNVGSVLHSLGRYNEALPLLRRAYSADPKSYQVCNLLGVCLLKCEHAPEAIDLFEAATRANPEKAEGWANLAVALQAVGRHGEACECAERSVALNPHSATALFTLGTAWVAQGKNAEAIEIFRRAVALPEPSARMLYDFGNNLLACGLNEEAVEQFARGSTLAEKDLRFRWAAAIAHIKPIYQSGAELTASRQQFAKALVDIEQWCRANVDIEAPFGAVGSIQPFYLAYQPFCNRELLSRYGALCAAWMATMPLPPPNIRSRTADGKIRVGIISSHIRDHSVWNAITSGWVYNLDPAKFELYLFQLESESDAETLNAKRAVTYFEDKPTTLTAWVQAIQAKELDVIIYPEIGMDPATSQLASLRLAPVQAASWGHPECTGLPTVDLFISGDAMEPVDAENNYCEHLIRLPNLGVHVKPIAPVILNPGLKKLNLPTNEALLLCAGSPFKYSPIDDDVWVQIAKRLVKATFWKSSGGRLVFFRSRIEAMDRMLENRLRAAFDREGVDFDAHVSIIPNLDRGRFFGLMRQSALMLDSLGFSGFNTAIQGIECDLPVLAYEGQFMRGRLASAVMRRLDLPELVASTKEEFVHKAVELAGNPKERRRLQAKIRERRAILFHDLEPVRALERHLTEAVTRRQLLG